MGQDVYKYQQEDKRVKSSLTLKRFNLIGILTCPYILAYAFSQGIDDTRLLI